MSRSLKPRYPVEIVYRGGWDGAERVFTVRQVRPSGRPGATVGVVVARIRYDRKARTWLYLLKGNYPKVDPSQAPLRYRYLQRGAGYATDQATKRAATQAVINTFGPLQLRKARPWDNPLFRGLQ